MSKALVVERAEPATPAGRQAAQTQAKKPEAETSADRRFRLFTTLWAIAAMAHLLNAGGQGLEALTGWLTLAAAIFVLASPGSLRRLMVLALVQLVDVVWLAPFWADHQLLMAIVNISILLRGWQFWRARRSAMLQPGAEGDFISAHASSMQVLMLVAYVGAAIAKYNSAFLEPATSCATFIADLATGGLAPRTGPSALADVILAVGPETLIPLILLVPATRRLGVRLAATFHFFVSVSPLIAVEDFTLTLYPLFFLFLPEHDIDALVAAGRRQLDGPTAALLRRIRPEAARVGVLTGATAAVVLAAPVLWLMLYWLLGLVIAGGIMIVLWRSLSRPGGEPARLHRPPTGHLLVTALMLLFVLSPYLGLRNTGVFTMFSNLQTSGTGTNHLFMPSVHVVAYQNDLVVPAAGSSDHFDELIEDGLAVHYFEVQRIFAENADAVLIGTRNGLPIDSTTAEFTIAEPSPVAAKLLNFRPVASVGDPPCIN